MWSTGKASEDVEGVIDDAGTVAPSHARPG
jgi:hypothetical protein